MHGLMEKIACFAIILSAGSASATTYLHKNLKQVLLSSDVIVRATVITNIPTGDHRRSCAVQVDEVLSGTLTADTIQVNRNYIRMGLPRNEYRSSETLVFCLQRMENTPQRPWPQHSPHVSFISLLEQTARVNFQLWTVLYGYVGRRMNVEKKSTMPGKDYGYIRCLTICFKR